MYWIATIEPEGEGWSDFLEDNGGRCLVEFLLETVPYLFRGSVRSRDTHNYGLSTLHLDIPNHWTVLGNPIIVSFDRFGSGGGWRLKGRLRDQARDICPELLSHQELWHSGRPGEPVGAVKGFIFLFLAHILLEDIWTISYWLISLG